MYFFSNHLCLLMRNKILPLSLLCFMIKYLVFHSYFIFKCRALYFTSVINYIYHFQFSTLLEVKQKKVEKTLIRCTRTVWVCNKQVGIVTLVGGKKDKLCLSAFRVKKAENHVLCILRVQFSEIVVTEAGMYPLYFLKNQAESLLFNLNFSLSS